MRRQSPLVPLAGERVLQLQLQLQLSNRAETGLLLQEGGRVGLEIGPGIDVQAFHVVFKHDDVSGYIALITTDTDFN